ncbi:hypothetical protein TWF225_004188 [Orbilia oligospora]|uniref:lytic cellulose monooxygenase (C4-dehydrogenating) n=1 Tax=Orbilia oligospora TaxID=2813651 RepID=A0A7C8PWR9_ORBOL|nr:hypothetical protein TWF751_007366 [Orbilia oligospora]KAF3187481.1 hypothetical protein TWF225_004188 [Orbilia oligospora]KAF3267229.1 hypothetical protein TWF128_010164 [Orbilia oligospora]KAF3272782.1 hypothetical protein TWF217_000244 [Orbilia oligospora]TGJ64752.1 hypothetical protein EYR41_010788 [Orbilia oligospora]
MQLTSTILLLSASLASAHYIFPALILNGQATGDWQYVKKAANINGRGPIEDINSDSLRCCNDPKAPKAATANVEAGNLVGFTVASRISHPGPLLFYMARVPDDKTAADFDGEGTVWFKVHEDQPANTSNGIWWPEDITEVYVKIPRCLPDGEYLLRVEHIALHNAYQTGGAQFFLGCAQLNVTGGWVGATPSTPPTLVSFPGAYNATDPGIKLNIWAPDAISYVNPGPPVYHCYL